eukprot:Phypoly_transcript_05423.p1 GENE.Phypoly_transcript_05423~~Phypoly_transcript_05423.p1  ORF type:complete len:587 (+),score=80.68 Phypoly_transcript_05423:173-1933(+)
MEPIAKKQKTEIVTILPWSARRKKSPTNSPTTSPPHSILDTPNPPCQTTFPTLSLNSERLVPPMPFTEQISPISFTLPPPSQINVSSTKNTSFESTFPQFPTPIVSATSKITPTSFTPPPKLPHTIHYSTFPTQQPQTHITYTPISRPLSLSNTTSSTTTSDPFRTSPDNTPTQTTQDATTQQDATAQESQEVECSVNDLVAPTELERDSNSGPPSKNSGKSPLGHIGSTFPSHDSNSDEDPTYTSSQVKNTKITRHLERVMQGRINCEAKSLAIIIAEGLQVSEYKDFLMSAFSSSMTVQPSKAKKKVLDQRKRKPSPIDYIEEIRSMMHSFGDVANALRESAQFLELIAVKYITLLLKLIMEVVPKKNTEIEVEVLAVALLPDLKKVYKIQQWISFMAQGRGFTHATETSKGTDGVGGTPDDPNTYTQTGMQALELISSESRVRPKAPQDEALNALFSSTLWVERMGRAKEDVQAERLARAAAKDKLSSSIPLAEYEFYEDCSKASFTKPNKRAKFEQFIQANCMATFSLAFSPISLDVIGLLTREFLEEIVVGALQKRVEGKKKSLEPIDILMYLQGLKQKLM